MNRAIVLRAYASGEPHPSMFAAEDRPVPTPGEGEARVRTLALSMDPFPRMRMTGGADGPPQLKLGDVVISRGLAVVEESRRPDLAPGDLVVCEPGWQERATVAGPVRVVPDEAVGRAALGVLGPSGLTALFALTDVADVRAGETVVVTAAAGSVGSAACWIARDRGADVVAIASGPEQCAWLRDALGVARVIDRLATDDLAGALREAAPGGVHAALDTVGGATFEAILTNAAPRARIVMAGFISAYGGERPRYVDPYALVFKRARLTGFLLADFADRFEDGHATLEAMLRTGRLIAHETIADGLDAAPEAFCGLFRSPAPGKQLVRVADLGEAAAAT